MRRYKLIAVANSRRASQSRVRRRRQPSRPPGWEFSITPYGWFAGLSGNRRTPLGAFPSRNFNANFNTILSDLSTIPIMGTAEARYGRFGLAGDLLYILGLKSDLDTRDIAF